MFIGGTKQKYKKNTARSKLFPRSGIQSRQRLLYLCVLVESCRSKRSVFGFMNQFEYKRHVSVDRSNQCSVDMEC